MIRISDHGVKRAYQWPTCKGTEMARTNLLFYSILFYHAGLLLLILFVAAFSHSPESQTSTPSLSPVNRFLKGNYEYKDHSGNRYEDRRIVQI